MKQWLYIFTNLYQFLYCFIILNYRPKEIPKKQTLHHSTRNDRVGANQPNHEQLGARLCGNGDGSLLMIINLPVLLIDL